MSSENSSESDPEWTNIPLRADEPAHCALFKHLLNEHGFKFTETPAHIAVLMSDAERLSQVVENWAFNPDMPDDERTSDTLNALLREIGNIVMEGLNGTNTLPRAVVNGIDLR
jgi:hypothetical protein